MTTALWVRYAILFAICMGTAAALPLLREHAPGVYEPGSFVIFGVVVAGLFAWIAWPWLQRYVRRDQ